MRAREILASASIGFAFACIQTVAHGVPFTQGSPVVRYSITITAKPAANHRVEIDARTNIPGDFEALVALQSIARGTWSADGNTRGQKIRFHNGTGRLGFDASGSPTGKYQAVLQFDPSDLSPRLARQTGLKNIIDVVSGAVALTNANPAPAVGVSQYEPLDRGLIGMFDPYVEQAVEKKLRDPDSAKFGPMRGQEQKGVNGAIVCGTVNAKNGFGGYAGDQSYVVILSWGPHGIDDQPKALTFIDDGSNTFVKLSVYCG